MVKKVKNKIVVICAHPDDEVIGCGGTIAFYKKKNYEILVIFFTHGESSRNFDNNNLLKRNEFKRFNSSHKASLILGGHKIINFGLKDNELDKYSNLFLTKKIETVLKTFKADIVLTHAANDLNIDHRKVNQAVQTACRTSGMLNIKKILCFEIASSTNNLKLNKKRFSPNFYVDISRQIDLKKKALKCYKSQLKPYPNPLSYKNIINLSKYRGSEVNLNYAEAFEVIRIIVN